MMDAIPIAAADTNANEGPVFMFTSIAANLHTPVSFHTLFFLLNTRKNKGAPSRAAGNTLSTHNADEEVP